MIFNTLLQGSMQLLGVLGQGAVPSSDETADAFALTNLLIDSWNTERLNIVQVGVASYPLVTGTAIYTIGPGGAGAAWFNAARPVKIEKAGITFANPGGAGVLRTECNLISGSQYAVIVEKGVAGTTATGLYYDHAYPLGSLYLTPVPTFTSSTRSLELWTWAALAAFPDFVTDVPLAPGYARAFQTALAIELAPMFDAEPTDMLVSNAAAAKAAIRALNAALPTEEPGQSPANDAKPDTGS